MKNINFRYLTLITLLSVTCIAVRLLTQDQDVLSNDGVKAIEGIPLEIGHWKGHDKPLENNIYEILETRAIIHRQFVSNKTQEVFLSIVYYSNAKVDFHAPEQCFGSQGIALETSSKELIFPYNGNPFELQINQMTSSKATPDNLVYYFYKTGKSMGPSFIKLRLHIALRKFTSKTLDGALIRVSTPVHDGDITKAEGTLNEFISLLYPLLIEQL